MKALRIGVATAALFTVLQAPARADCACAANGTRYQQGAVVCITLPSGRLLAECSKVLNNSSWRKLQDGCPLALLPPLAGERSAQAPTGVSDRVRPDISSPTF